MNTKAHLVIPQEILAQVDKVAGKRKRSLFIAEATREKLEREWFLKVLEETHGAWTDENHPGLKTRKDLEQYLQDKRKAYSTRLKGVRGE